MISYVTFDEYKKLYPDEQEFLLWNRAVELLHKEEHSYKYILYQLDSFYIEVLYNISLDSIIDLIAFENVDRLDSYMEKVDINEIYTLL